MHKLTVAEMEKMVESGGNYIVDFYADWCGPCRAIAPTLEEIHNEGNVEVIKIDVDAHEREELEKYGISSIPTIYAFKGGQPVSKMIGAQPKAKLLKSFE
jgi:thioredoxin 1